MVADLNDNAILLMMEMTARSERDAGHDGWSRPPDEIRDACDRLVAAGLAEKRGEMFRPTDDGSRSLNSKISKAQ